MIGSPTFTDIRHPEELSLLRPVEEKKKKKDKDLCEEIYDLTEVPLSTGTYVQLNTSQVPFYLYSASSQRLSS